MSEEMMIQELYNQIDRLITMQNTMLTVVGALFAIMIGVFAFFQWRINNKDQSIIIKTAKEELLSTLIENYNLLSINENQRLISETINWSEENYKSLKERLSTQEKKINKVKYQEEMTQITYSLFLIHKEFILISIQEENPIANDKRDEIFRRIESFVDGNKKDQFRKDLARHLLFLLNLYSKEKIEQKEIDIILNKKS